MKQAGKKSKAARNIKTAKGTSGKAQETPPVYASSSTKGLVNWYLHVAAQHSKKSYNPNDVVKLVRMGLPMGELETLRKGLEFPMEKLADALGISKTTLHRRKNTGRLDKGVSDKIVRFARLLGTANKIFGSETEGRRWLTTKQFGLGGAVPLDYAETEVGAREVENLLTRIDHGVYS